MNVRAATEIVRALADEDVRHVFGIPGTHNIELYDALAAAEGPEAVLVTSELAGAFLADGYSRSSNRVGVVNVVPGAGVTHSLSGIAEAWMDTVPMVVLAAGIRTDIDEAYQLHDIDQLAMLRPVTKDALRIEHGDELYPAIRRAFRLARAGAPGPVAVEIPAQFFFLRQQLDQPTYEPEPEAEAAPDPDLVRKAAELLAGAERPMLYLGRGAGGAADLLVPLAERLGAPVTTTFSGKGVFPESHPLWLWNGFGRQAPPFARRITDGCDCLMAIGCRFGEVATAGYGLDPPPTVIHVDIDSNVLDRNVPTTVAVAADARLFVEALDELLEGHRSWKKLASRIAGGHERLETHRRRKADTENVSPHGLFTALQQHCRPNTVYATDSGNGTFLAAEHLRLEAPGRFLAPTDYSCMGYAVPAAIGARFADPDRDVVALPGDGALLMTGLELLSAANNRAAPLVCVLRDGTLSQITQFQKMMVNRVTASVLPEYDLEGLARTTGCRHFRVSRDDDLATVLPAALDTTRGGTPALIDVAIDYSEPTYFTRGAVKNVFGRLPLSDRAANILRAVARRLTGG